MSSTALIDTLWRERYNEITMKQGKKKFIIGLTGKIGAGKSLVRAMLEHLGVFGIDADALSRAVLDDESLQAKVVDTFGLTILDQKGNIDRAELARIVFSEQKALKKLEALLHPPIIKKTRDLVHASRLPIIAIEAIKLLESDMANMCDVVWVADANERVVLDRLADFRGLSPDEAKSRLANQADLAEKFSEADVLINNSGSVLETWHQVKGALEHLQAERPNIAGRIFAEASKDLVTPDTDYVDAVIARLPHLQPHSPALTTEIIMQDPYRAICTHFFFNHVAPGGDQCLTAWERSLRDFTLLHSEKAGCLSKEMLQPMLSGVERFAALFLAHALLVPINKENAAGWEGNLPGSFTQIIDLGEEEHPGKAGYNLYRKAIE